MKIIRIVSSLIILFTLSIMNNSECLALKRIAPENTKDAIVEKYLKNRQLDPVEGIWSYIQKGITEEIVITKNPTSTVDADYVGIKVAGDAEGKVGELKITLKKTAVPGVFNGKYFLHISKEFLQSQAIKIQISLWLKIK